jgi:hypothetical protein
MHALIYDADAKTHIKIVAVALITAILIVLIGIHAHLGA